MEIDRGRGRIFNKTYVYIIEGNRVYVPVTKRTMRRLVQLCMKQNTEYNYIKLKKK